MTSLLLAHGADGLAGDGVPGAVLYAIVVAGVAIGAVGLRARGARLLGGPAVAPLTIDGSESSPWPIDAVGRPARAGLRALALAALVLALAVGWFGSDLSGLSPLPSLILVLWWVVPVLSALLGDWWRLVDPYDALAGVVLRGRGRPAGALDGGARTDTAPPAPRPAVGAHDDATDDDDGDDEAGDWWVPAALLATLAWMLTCWLDGTEPRALAAWLTALTVVMGVGAALGGRAWVRRSSPFAVLCGTVAAAAPVDWAAGRPRLRSPLRGLAGRAGGQRSTAVVLVVLGTAFWEAVSGSRWWAELIGASGQGGGATAILWSTVGLAWCVLLAGAAWVGTGALAEAVATRHGAAALDEPFAPDAVAALAPLAVVGVTAHQLSNLLVQAQDLLFFFGPDPFAQGWDPFGTKSWLPDEALFGAAGQAWIRFGMVALALAVLLAGAWDRLAARVGAAVVHAGWVVAGFTGSAGCLGLWLLLDA